MLRFLALLCVMLTSCAASGPRTSLDIAHHTVAIMRPDGHIIGSGTLVRSSLAGMHLITADHVLEDETLLSVCGIPRRADELVCADIDVTDGDYYTQPGKDIAILPMQIRVADPARIGRGLRVGERVWGAGFPRAELRVWSGQSIGVRSPYVAVTGYCDFGISGGGVYRNRNTLVGVISAMPLDEINGQMIPNHSLCYITPLD